MSTFVILPVLLYLSTCSCIFWPTKVKTCLATHHFWCPFYGSIHPKAFVAGIDRDGDRKFISRVVGPDQRSWQAPSTISERNIYQVYIAENQRTQKFIEILCVHTPHPGFGWRGAHLLLLDTIINDCCLVEGGSGYLEGKRASLYIGRVVLGQKYYFGGVTNPSWWQIFAPHALIVYDDRGIKRGFNEDFEVLAYDCCTKSYCRGPNKADCCYDIM